MATHDYVIANASGAAVRSDLNNALAAIVSNNSNTTEPATTYAYQSWADTTAGLMKIRNSTNDGWVSLYNLDGSSLGPGKVTFGATEVVFNDAGNNVDFRIEGDTNANLFFVDASADKIGIGTTSPQQLLHLSSTGFPAIRITDADNSTYFDITNSDGDIILKADEGNTQSSSAIRFNIDSGEKARIDSSGRLLVGTSTARTNIFNTVAAKLFQVESDGGTAGASFIRSSNDGGSVDLVLGKSRSASVGGNTVVQSGDAIGSISFQGNDGSEFVAAASIAAEVDSTPGANDMPGRLVFSTTADGSSSPTERMRIKQNGLTFFRSDSTSTIIAGTSSGSGATPYTFVGRHSATDIETGTDSFRVTAGGTIYAVNTTVQSIASERRLKENIEPIDPNVAWETVKSVPYYSYNFIGVDPSQINYGPIADEVPDEMRVETDETDDVGVIHSYNNSMLQARLYVALQTALTRIEELEAKVAALEAS